MVDPELESLFEDLAEELKLPAAPIAVVVRPQPNRVPSPSAKSRFSFDGAYVQQATAALDAAVAVGSLLSSYDHAAPVTRPYEVPVEELLNERDVVSSMSTVPVNLDELPDEAWPTELHALPA